jgi:hypothetical protein
MSRSGCCARTPRAVRERREGDDVREFLLRDERLVAAEILTASTTAAIVAVRR